MFQVENLRFRYPKNTTDTLEELEFTIKRGEIFGLLGPSGVGKSTTQKILTRLLTGYEGTVLYDGKDLLSYGREYYNEVGVGFEVPVHFSKLTAEENLNFFKRLYRSTVSIDDLLRRVGLYEDRKKQVSTFSKGMKVRLNFIRAFLNSPRFLFLDEPTNGLDPVNARILKDMILEFRDEGGTVFLTTHLMSDVDELCDRVAFMIRGKIAEIDNPKSLKVKHGQRRVSVEFESEQGVEKQSFSLDNLGENPEFLEVIRNRNIITMHSEETTLEDIFIKITGVEVHG
ncbi:MAG TPA: ATP-binding protein [Firmicutes bacterium]|jgi:fluoroquinolone transport system ATP-binding protein|nr:ATP-binding protein [Bacillota bacterium]